MKKRHQKQRNVIIVLAAMMLVAAITAGSVFAYLRAQTDAVKNDFGVAGEADPTVEESVNDPLTVKKDVTVKVPETGYAVYVRAVIVVTWKNSENGDVLGQAPVAGTDYVIDLNTTGWFEEGGYYYCTNYVKSGDNSPILINSVSLAPNVTAPSGFGLNVEIITQTIQAAGTTDVSNGSEIPAVTDAWGITVNSDGTLKKTT